MSEPWIEWQKQGTRISHHEYELRSCPFCCRRHLTICLSFDDKAARVECRYCLAEGPWCWHEDKETVLHDAVEAWNGYVRPRSDIGTDSVSEKH